MDGKKLLEIRNSLKLTQKEMAKKMGIAWQTLSAVENGREIPDSKVRIYEVGLQQLFSELDNIDMVSDVAAEYIVKDKKNTDQNLLLEIYNDIKELRKENEQLKNTIAHFIEENEREQKLNELSRTQLKLSINIIKSLDKEIEAIKKSTDTKQDIGNTKQI